MNNADRMRAELSDQMLKLTAEELDSDDNVIDLGNLFTCEKCRKEIGECVAPECWEQFLKYCEMED